jgi:hypothetical protein
MNKNVRQGMIALFSVHLIISSSNACLNQRGQSV